MSLSRVSAGLLLSASLLASSASAAPPTLAKAADKAISILATKGVAGEVAMADMQGSVEDRVTGLANRENRTPHKVGQTWLWASVTKQVAATFVLQQVGQGKMALDAPISAYLKDFSGNRTLTLKDLLQHRTDLPNPWEAPLKSDGVPAFYLNAETGRVDQMAARGFCGGPGKANPNREFRYNNCDYLVLGCRSGSGHRPRLQDPCETPIDSGPRP